MTARIAPLDPSVVEGQTKELFGVVKSKFGVVPNALKTMGHSPAVLEGYLSLGGSLAKGALPAKVREQIALAVSQQNGCEYCLSAHSFTGKHAGLKPEELLAARSGSADDPKAQAILDLTTSLLEKHGNLSDEQLTAARAEGVTDEEIVEVVGNVAFMTLTNFLNNTALTDVDFPKVSAVL